MVPIEGGRAMRIGRRARKLRLVTMVSALILVAGRVAAAPQRAATGEGA